MLIMIYLRNEPKLVRTATLKMKVFEKVYCQQRKTQKDFVKQKIHQFATENVGEMRKKV